MRPALAFALVICAPGASAQESVPCWYDAANDMIRTCAENLEVPANGCTSGEGLTERCSDRASCECPATLALLPGVTVSVTVRTSRDGALAPPRLGLGLLGMLGAANLRPLALVALATVHARVVIDIVCPWAHKFRQLLHEPRDWVRRIFNGPEDA